MHSTLALFRVKTNLSEKESHRPGDQACQRLSKPSEHPGSRPLETPSQTDGGSVRGEKKGSVLVISMMWALDSRRAFRLGALPGFPVASERECVSHSLRNATPKAGVWTYFTNKGVTPPPYYWNISFVSLSLFWKQLTQQTLRISSEIECVVKNDISVTLNSECVSEVKMPTECHFWRQKFVVKKKKWLKSASKLDQVWKLWT